MTDGNILVIDDNLNILRALEILLTPVFGSVTTLSNPNGAISELGRRDYNLVLLDMNFRAGINSGNEGLFWIKKIRESHPEVSVVMMTAYGDVELAVKSLKLGATDFVIKPWDNDKLLATLLSALQLNLTREEVRQLKEKESLLKKEMNRDQRFIIGNSPEIMRVMNLVRKVAKTEADVLITGENGTGKELIAREIHRLSDRSQEVLVSVDMGAITETLFESELFGHVRGAFTDAHESRPGKFEAASKGTLFLDEIGNLPLHMQSKLLVAIQSRQIYRVGSNKPVAVDIRLICSTNKDLGSMVKEGLFREDLLYRINTIHIEVPPLRARADDINILADFFLRKYSAKYNKTDLKINSYAIEKLMNYSWPGNVRELQHAIEKAVILSDDKVLKPGDFFMKQMVSGRRDENPVTLDEMERKMIREAIEQHSGNLTAAADQLGITRQTIYNKIKRLKL